MPRRVLIMGAAGRDFHNFNVVYRDDPDSQVVAFTATQIPFIDDRRYPPSLAGERYPDGIQIHDESELVPLIRDLRVDDVVFSYSDVSHEYVMHKASTALAAGANFVLLGPNATMLQPTVPTVAVTAVRTGVGKSQTTRADRGSPQGGRQARGRRSPPDAVRGPGGAARAAVRGARGPRPLQLHDRGTRGVRAAHHVSGTVIYAGVDYGAILEQAQAECDVLLWDGGNNDLPFYRPTVWITLVDPLRAGHELRYHPGRDQPAGGRRDRDQQDGLRDTGAGRAARGDDRRGQPRRRRGQGELEGHVRRPRGGRVASASSWWRTARRSPTAR